ncbi:MAG: hypothetical protein IJH12_01515 [Clostridia bacterium]|nr:hypothetical protein [Clostridia bacterium]
MISQSEIILKGMEKIDSYNFVKYGQEFQVKEKLEVTFDEIIIDEETKAETRKEQKIRFITEESDVFKEFSALNIGSRAILKVDFESEIWKKQEKVRIKFLALEKI